MCACMRRHTDRCPRTFPLLPFEDAEELEGLAGVHSLLQLPPQCSHAGLRALVQILAPVPKPVLCVCTCVRTRVCACVCISCTERTSYGTSRTPLTMRIDAPECVPVSSGVPPCRLSPGGCTQPQRLAQLVGGQGRDVSAVQRCVQWFRDHLC